MEKGSDGGCRGKKSNRSGSVFLYIDAVRVAVEKMEIDSSERDVPVTEKV